MTVSPVFPLPGAGALTVPGAGAEGATAHEFAAQVGAAVHEPLGWHVAVADPVSV